MGGDSWKWLEKAYLFFSFLSMFRWLWVLMDGRMNKLERKHPSPVFWPVCKGLFGTFCVLHFHFIAMRVFRKMMFMEGESLREDVGEATPILYQPKTHLLAYDMAII